MSTWGTFCAELRLNGKWILNQQEIFPFPDDAWQRQVGDKRTRWAFPFATERYHLYAFLAGVRNEFGCVPLAEPKGVPEDISADALEIFAPGPWVVDEYGESREAGSVEEILRVAGNDRWGFSWLTLAELLAFDYEQRFLDVSNVPYTTTSYRSFLGDAYMQCLDALKRLGPPNDVRIVFAFQ